MLDIPCSPITIVCWPAFVWLSVWVLMWSTMPSPGSVNTLYMSICCVLVCHQHEQLQYHKFIQSYMFFRIRLNWFESFRDVLMSRPYDKVESFGMLPIENFNLPQMSSPSQKSSDSISLTNLNICSLLQSKLPSFWNRPSTALRIAFCDGFDVIFIAESSSDVDTTTFASTCERNANL